MGDEIVRGGTGGATIRFGEAVDETNSTSSESLFGYHFTNARDPTIGFASCSSFVRSTTLFVWRVGSLLTGVERRRRFR
jgi:hypothetical protein